MRKGRLAAPVQATVVAGSASLPFAGSLGKALDAPLASTEVRRFPDGEAYVRVHDDLQGRHAVVVQASHPDTALVEMLLLQDAAREAGAQRVTAVVPYLGYARQDRAFHDGEAVSSRASAKALSAQADMVVTVDPHKEEVLGFFTCEAVSVSAVPQLATRLGDWDVDAVLAPDKGARDRAGQAAAILDVPFDHLEKTRHSATHVEMRAKDLDVAGRRVAIVDDMVASGGTVREATRQLKAQGAAAVFAACTHGLFTDGAVPKLLGAGTDRILCTDTLPSVGCDVVSAAPAVAHRLREAVLTR